MSRISRQNIRKNERPVKNLQPKQIEDYGVPGARHR